MATITVAEALGLQTSSNQLTLQPGSLRTANNVVIRAKGVIEPRHGQAHVTYNPAATTANGFFYDDTLLVHTTGDALQRDTGAAFSSYSGTYTAPNPTVLRMKGVNAKQNFYFTTSSGIYVLDSTTGTPRTAGLERPGWSLSSKATTTPAWLPTGYSVAYRFTACYYDANGRLIESAPSGREVVTNATGGDRSVSLGPQIPPNLPSTYFIRLHRSRMVPSDQSPDDRMYIAHETALKTTAAGAFISIEDCTPEEALVVPSYFSTEATPRGILDSNTQPPLAKDASWFAGRMWFANTTTRKFLEVQLLATEGAKGLMAHATVPVNQWLAVGKYAIYVYYAGGTATYFGGVVEPTTGLGTLSISQKLDQIGQFIVGAYNDNLDAAFNDLRAFYISDDSDLPGRMLFEAVDLTASNFCVASSNLTCWWPVPQTLRFSTSGGLTRTGTVGNKIVTVTTTASHGYSTGDVVQFSTGADPIPEAYFNDLDANFPTSSTKTITVTGATTFTYAEEGTNTSTSGTNRYLIHKVPTTDAGFKTKTESYPNRLYYSKPEQPEAVPALNYIDIGAKEKDILRIVPLREKLFVFKEDGIYVVSGEYPFRVDLLDDTVRLLAADSAVTVANQIFALTNQGVVSVTDSGVQIVSRAIEADLLSLFGSSLTALKRYTFGVGHESERSYHLWVPSSSSDTYATQGFVFNTVTSTWTRWPISRTWGIVDKATDYLYMGHVSSARVWKERKNYSFLDTCDEIVSVSIASSATNTVTLSSASGVAVGDVLNQSSTYAVITAVNSNTLTLATTESWSVAAATVFKAFQCDVVYQVQTAGAPGAMKHFSEATLHIRDPGFYDADLTVSTDVATTATNQAISFPNSRGTAGASASWGTSLGPKNLRELIALEKQRAAYLYVGFSINEALSQWKLQGFSAELNDVAASRSAK